MLDTPHLVVLLFASAAVAQNVTSMSSSTATSSSSRSPFSATAIINLDGMALLQYPKILPYIQYFASDLADGLPFSFHIWLSLTDSPDYWNEYVGPVSVAAVNTTVSPTPVASSELISPPTLHYGPFPTGQEVYAMPKNESWKFPKDFWWGVASAAYQVEGAVKDEGR